MFCPRCGNQPSSDRVRFCPNCGLRLDGVADLLAHDGLPANPQNISLSNEPSPRRRGIQRGAKLTFIGLAIFFPILAFSIGVANGPGPLSIPATIFFAGIFWMLYYRLFGDEYPTAPKPAQVISPPASQQAYLPPQSVPVYRPPIEAPKEQSVIEHTTRSLEKQ